MKYASYYSQGQKVGAVIDSELWDLRQAIELYLLEEEKTPDAHALANQYVPSDMAHFIRENHGRMDVLEYAVTRLRQDADRTEWLKQQGIVQSLEGTRLLPPIVRPGMILAIGSTYRESINLAAAAQGVDPITKLPADVKPSFFKSTSSVIGDGDVLHFPHDNEHWDYEAEFGIVIGRHAFRISEEEADAHIFGYTILNDVSVRGFDNREGGMHGPRAKGADTFAPLGPWIATRDALGRDPNDLAVRCWINDELRTDTRTSNMMWTVQRMVAVSSQVIRLGPGDVIATGAPPGSALHNGKYIKEGDVVRMEIEGIGVLTNPVGSPH